MEGVGTFLLVLGFVSAVPVIFVNTYLWMRFTALYVRASPQKMPFLPLDFGGRWQQVLRTPNDDPIVERLRMQLRLSQRLLFLPFAFVLPGVALIAASSR